MSPNPPSALIRIQDVMEMTTFSRNMIYKLINNGQFPRQSKIGAGSYWKRKEVESWLENLSPATDEELQPITERLARNATKKAH